MKRSGRRSTFACLFASVASLAAAHYAVAASAIWTGAAGDGVFDTGGNWSPAAAPGATDGTTVSQDVASFAGTFASSSVAVTLNTTRNLDGIVLDNTNGTTFTLGNTAGPSLLLTDGGTIQVTSAETLPASGATTTALVINSPLVLAGTTYTVRNDNSNGEIFFNENGTVQPGSKPATLILDGSNLNSGNTGNSAFIGALTDSAGGSLSVTKNGSGTWELRATTAAPNTYSGDTVINAGMLRLNGAGAGSLNTHFIINNTGMLRVATNGIFIGPVSVETGGQLVASSSTIGTNIVSNAGPALTLDYTNGNGVAFTGTNITFAGTVADQGGLTLNSSTSNAFIDFQSTSAQLGLGTVMRPFTIAKTNASSGYDLRLRGVINGGGPTGGILKLGPGILRIDNPNNSFTGTLEVKEGEVFVNVNNVLNGLPNILVDGGDFHFGGGITESTGPVTVTAGTLSSSNNASILVAPSYTFNVADGASAGALATGNGPVLADNGSTPSPLIKLGNGTASLSGIDTYTGGTTIMAGTLAIGAGATNGSIVGNVTDNGTLAFNHSDFITFTGTISGSGSVAQQGTNNLLLAATNNSYGGGTVINSGGTLTATTDGNLGATGGSITLNGGTFATNGPISSARNVIVTSAGGSITMATGNDFATTGTAGGSGTLTKLGAGALTVSSFNLGGLNVSAGPMVMTANGGKAGVVSALTIGDDSLATTAKLDLNDNDLIVNYSGASPASTIRTLLSAGYNGGAWNGNGITSTFAQSHSGQGLGYGEATDVGVTNLDGVAITGPAVVVKYTYYGDSSLDGKVDLGNDFNLFVQGFLNGGSTWELGDYNYDGHVDVNDFQLFVKGFQSQGGQLGELDDVLESSSILSASQKASLLSVVPEPSSLAGLGIIAGVAAIRRRRGK